MNRGRSLPSTATTLNRSYMSKLEKGASYPGLEIIAKLATVLEIEPAELIRMVERRTGDGA
jgi:transcriptional regulator with XRE-family HTH domain